MKTLTKKQVFERMADNVRNGKSPVDRLRVGRNSEWIQLSEQACLSGIASGKFEFILAPITHNLNGYDVPAPETEAPEGGVDYWVLDATEDDGVYKYEWEYYEERVDQNAIRNGLWLSKEDAIANAKALRGENPYADNE